MAPINTQNLRERFGHFRVLVMGRVNAGKATILQKVCNTTDHPEIYDTKGKKVYTQRRNHGIRNEMVFKSNPGFVFHDLCGFEAGSEGEFDCMKKFILECANAMELKE
ncbi:hypothetical protein BDR04DRAFT_1017781 [Suillus decipiens]|nr:hypothetical protein BDR04DRAFT_1017781 [Suillus decipiens]